ncbi:hypothetical protein P691DRAFT_807330 [Macrolepiota fuliginosa MF-IS2]|uniref:C2H2-type domain-containing protein n=1 Tax=Macrolepiota fuliginosa MF-IS2 TaxID=1400762 RepID=A0A9P5X6A9_9AGAR|nr:hypothetical protein P691DRAFT_807330 [Macrolepiota fuliginosa MF-IS2]
MVAQNLTRDTVQHPRPGFPSLNTSFGNIKRHAIYIPESFFERARQAIAEADAASTWEFPATISPSTPTSSESSSSAASSPAQDIIIRYRAGLPLPLDGSETRSNLSIDDEDDEDDSSLVFYTPIEGPGDLQQLPIETRVAELENTEVKLIYRQSCHQGLSRTREEALQVVQTHGLREADSIVCQRLGCSDTLRSTKDLMFHLHIHDINDGLVSCSRCHHFYENQQELDVHLCIGRRVRSFVAPFRSILTRIISRLAHHK